jgi:hypothetical protein
MPAEMAEARKVPTYHAEKGKVKPYPHLPCCEGCAAEEKCCKCGKKATRYERCVSVRCPDCCTGYSSTRGGCGHTRG